MTTWIPWKIARKELKVISRKRSILFYTIGFPLLVAIVFFTYHQEPNSLGNTHDAITWC